jgi:DNA-binding transcriptional regulator YdaS (Cro superfamily)
MFTYKQKLLNKQNVCYFYRINKRSVYKMTSIDSIIKKCGGVRALSEQLKINNVMTVRQWLQRNTIPARWVLSVEKISGVPCYEIRPDIYPVERFKKAS